MAYQRQGGTTVLCVNQMMVQGIVFTCSMVSNQREWI